MLIREETGDDYAGIKTLDYAHDVIEKLRASGLKVVSLVAVEGDAVIGHVLFSKLAVEVDGRAVKAVSLAPLAVVPGRQRQGVGSKLTNEGLDMLRKKQFEAVIVLGHTTYYPRFGFTADLARHLASPFRGNPSFMGLELVPGALAGEKGCVTYPPAFGIGESV